MGAAQRSHLDFFLKSPVLLGNAVLAGMKRRSSGRIVHIGSDVTARPSAAQSAYVAAKSAQVGLARPWALELAPYGITVNTVAPGWVPVERHAGASAATLEGYKELIPAGRLGEPVDVAEVVRFLASPAGPASSPASCSTSTAEWLWLVSDAAVYATDAHPAPDSDFAPGELRHLVEGNRGRLLDPRRTPVTVREVAPERGSFVIRVDAFEDAGASWELGFEEIERFQFARAATRASDAALAELQQSAARFDRDLSIDCDPDARERTSHRLEQCRDVARAWLGERSGGLSIDIGEQIAVAWVIPRCTPCWTTSSSSSSSRRSSAGSLRAW